MKNLILTSLLVLFFGNIALTQDASIVVEVSMDTILLGNHFEVRFTVKNASGKFERPSFEGFNILAGPNTSSSMSMINGEVKQESSYSFILEPRDIGRYYIEPAYFTVSEEVLETIPVTIEVLPNPDNIVQENTGLRTMDNPFFEEFIPRKTEKKSTINRRKF